MKKVIFSGIQPTAEAPHIGNYLGALRNWVEMQNHYQCYYCVVDLHAITVAQAAEKLKEATYTTYALLLAIGINPNLSTLFVQSHNPYHSELAWILNCYTPVGELNRMTQFKEKSEKQKTIVSAGLYDYPVLMAADILLYDTDIVPVGEDQLQHIELTRNLAARFNKTHGQTFVLPQAKLIKETARIMSLKNPEQKMSKSDTDKSATIFLLDSKDKIRDKIMSAVTDSEKSINFAKERKGLFNLLTIYKALSGKQEKEIEEHFSGKGYKELKEELVELLIDFLAPIQQKYFELMSDKKELERLMRVNAEKAMNKAAKKTQEIKEKVGFVLLRD